MLQIRFLFIAMAYATTAFGADNCATIRLDKKGGPFDKIPVYNQIDFARGADTAICYAISAAQAIDYCRAVRGDKLEKVTSPLSVAANFSAFAPKKFTEAQGGPVPVTNIAISGGMEDQAANESRRRPLCDQRWLEQFVAEAKDGRAARARLALRSTSPGTENFLETIIAEIQAAKTHRPLHQNAQTYLCGLMKGSAANLEALSNAANAAVDQIYVTDQIATFLEKFCEGHSLVENCPFAVSVSRRNLPVPKQTSDGELSRLRNKALIQLLNDQFNVKTPSPLMIAYDPKILGDPKAPAISDDATSGEYSGGDGHASVIVGRERNSKTGHCGFWIRNSYGPGCTAQGEPISYAPCDHGSFLIDEEDLAKHLSNVSWIPNP